MSSFATDFHGTPEELLELAGKWMAEHPIVATAEETVDDAPLPGPPSRVLPVTPENFREVLARPDVSEVLFTEGPVTMPARSIYQILDEHPGGLCLQIGRCGPRGLEQARLATMDASNPMWKKMNRELKKMTTAGANLVWEDGRTGHDRNVRFTAAAKALAAAGTPLRQSAQCTYIYLPK